MGVTTMTARQTLLGLAALLIVVCLAGSASAIHGPYYLGYGEAWWGCYSTGAYAPRLPYYSLYPPVYYSYPVPRTYGQSPFAYPPVLASPPVQAEAAVDPPSPPPLRITNPYVSRSDETPSRPTTGNANPRPLVVYPTSGGAKPL